MPRMPRRRAKNALQLVASTFPSLAAQKGRIYFYPPSAMGAAVQPDIKLNGEKVGTTKPHDFYFVDRDPGNYEVTATTIDSRRPLTPGRRLA